MEREFCRHCAGLVEGPGYTWVCDQAGKEVEQVEHCPEEDTSYDPVPDSIVLFEIYIQDLSDEAREQLENIVGKNHNFDVFPLAVIPLQEEECR